MEVDPEYLRRHYASLSDEGLAEIDRAELVDAARRCYDDEVGQRRLKARVDEVELPASQPGRREEEFPVSSGAGEIPEWAGEGAEVFSVSSIHGPAVAEDAERARRVLAAAGIPCYLDTYEDPPDEGPAFTTHFTTHFTTNRWRVLVPGKLNMRATNILDRDIFNDDFEALWRTQLEMLSDRELAEAQPREVFCGLFDRMERVVRVYGEELSRRGLRAR